MIVAAGLDLSVERLAAYYPALADVTGHLNNRAGGWTQMFRASERPLPRRSPGRIGASTKSDAVTFAPSIRGPGLYSWGLNDENCPPAPMDSACPLIPGPRGLLPALEPGHNTASEQAAEVDDWILSHFN